MEIHRRKLSEIRSSGCSTSPRYFAHIALKPGLKFNIDGRRISQFHQRLGRKKQGSNASKFVSSAQNGSPNPADREQQNFNPTPIQQSAQSVRKDALTKCELANLRTKKDNLRKRRFFETTVVEVISLQRLTVGRRV